MSHAVSFLLLTFAVGMVLAGLFAIGAARQSSYLSREEEADKFRRHPGYGAGGWAGTSDEEGDR